MYIYIGCIRLMLLNRIIALCVSSTGHTILAVRKAGHLIVDTDIFWS